MWANPDQPVSGTRPPDGPRAQVQNLFGRERMDKRKVIPTVIGISMLVSSFVFAQTQPPPPPGGREARPDPRMEQAIDNMLQDMDTNGDGKISKKEWMAAQERQFKRLDRNGDGFITKDEIKSDMMDRMRESRPPERGRGPQ